MKKMTTMFKRGSVILAMITALVIINAGCEGSNTSSDGSQTSTSSTKKTMSWTPTSAKHTHSHSGSGSCPEELVVTVYITNTGEYPIDGTVYSNVPGARCIPSTISIKPGETTNFDVVFTCVSSGVQTGMVIFKDNESTPDNQIVEYLVDLTITVP